MNTIRSLLETYLVSIVSLASSFFVAQFIQPEGLGEFGVYMSITALGNILIEGGLQSYVVYAEDNLSRRAALQSVTVLVALIMLLVSLVLISLFALPYIAIFSIVVTYVAIALISIPSALLIKRNEYKLLMKLNIIPVTAGFIYLLVQVYFCERRVVDLLYEQASLIAAIQIFILFRSGLNIRLYFCLDFSELKLAYKYSYRIFLQGFQDRILNQGVFLFLGPNMQSSLGHFVNASKTHQFGVKKGVLGISRVLFTSLAGADEDTKSSLLHRSFKNLSWVLPLVFICLNIAISILFSFLPVYWETAELYSHLLSLDLISYPFLIFIQNFLNSKGETRASFVLNTLRFLIVSISWPLVLWTNDFIYFIYGFLFSGIFALIIGLRYLPKSLFRFPLGTFILVLLIIFTYGQLLHSFSWI